LEIAVSTSPIRIELPSFVETALLEWALAVPKRATIVFPPRSLVKVALPPSPSKG
jgi:hypothetical protein